MRARRKYKRLLHRRTLGNVAGVVGFLLLWYVVAASANNPAQIPTPSGVWRRAAQLFESGELVENAVASLQRLGVGYFLALLVGIPAGILMGMHLRVRSAINPVVEVFRPIPAIAWVPFLLVLIGVQGALYYSVTFYGSLFPILVNTASAVRSTESVYSDAARTLGASQAMVVREVIFPAALPGILTGMRVGLGTGWISIVAAELVGADRGLGFMINYYQQLLESQAVFVGMITIGILGATMNALIGLVGARGLQWARGTGAGA